MEQSLKHLTSDNEKTEIPLLSNEVQEIISHKPNWIVRNGTLLFLLIISALISTTFFISYPDIVYANAKLTSINAPKEVKAKIEGKLIKLHAIEGKFIQQGELLGFLESRADHYEVISLSQLADTLQIISETGNSENLSKYTVISYKNLGEVQQPFQTFMQSFYLFNQYLSQGYYLKKKKMLTDDIGYLQRLHANLLQQKTMQQEDAGLSKQTLDANESLNAEKVISALDYRNEKSKYIGKALIIPQITAAIISNKSSQHEKQKEIVQLENEISQQKGIFIQSLNTLKAQLEEWKAKYLLIAPIDGRIIFASFLQENQQLKINQTICFINPENTQYFAEVIIPQNNFGKINKGQKVLLKLPAYPYQEFGTIQGKLDFISNIPTDSGYLGKVSLIYGLKTNYKKLVQYRDGLLARGEIITSDTKLSDRIFNQLKNLINNHDK